VLSRIKKRGRNNTAAFKLSMQLNLRWQLIFFKNAKWPLHPSLNDDNKTFKLILYNGTISITKFKINFSIANQYYTRTLYMYITTLMKKILLKGKMEVATIIYIFFENISVCLTCHSPNI